MAKTVLLARPHPFIVAEMKPFLEHSGYLAAKLESLADLATQARSSAGVVISLAESSSLGETADEVFTRLRQAAPRAPVLFAAMLGFDKSQDSLERLAKMPVSRPRSLASSRWTVFLKPGHGSWLVRGSGRVIVWSSWVAVPQG